MKATINHHIIFGRLLQAQRKSYYRYIYNLLVSIHEWSDNAMSSLLSVSMGQSGLDDSSIPAYEDQAYTKAPSSIEECRALHPKTYFPPLDSFFLLIFFRL